MRSARTGLSEINAIIDSQAICIRERYGREILWWWSAFRNVALEKEYICLTGPCIRTVEWDLYYVKLLILNQIEENWWPSQKIEFYEKLNSHTIIQIFIIFFEYQSNNWLLNRKIAVTFSWLNFYVIIWEHCRSTF